MKKALAIVLSLILLVAAVGCSRQDEQPEETTAVTEPVVVVTEEVREKLDEALVQNQFEGIVCLTHNGEVVYESVSGVNDLGEPLTMESPMYIASVSKQFCAAAVLILRDQGKLSLDDTLDVYFPEYEAGKDITLKNLLNMASGIVDNVIPMHENPDQYLGQTKAENIAAFKEWVFAQPSKFQPGSKFEYSNVNYTLLSLIVEAVSGQEYNDFLRQNVLEPLGMNNTGFISEVPEHPQWALTYENIQTVAQLPAGVQGAGDLVSTAADLDIWMTALQNGQVVSPESYDEMTTMVNGYGYGLSAGLRGGFSHTGGIGTYSSIVYFNSEYGYNLYMICRNSSTYQNATGPASTALIGALYAADDAANK